MKKPGRPSLYTKQLGERICARLAAGESLRKICRDEDMPDEATCYRWALDPTHGFCDQYTRARAIQAERMADEIIELADSRLGEGDEGQFDNVQRSRLQVDTRKWYLSKVLPKKFGEKTAVTHSFDLSGLSNEELEALERIQSKLAPKP